MHFRHKLSPASKKLYIVLIFVFKTEEYQLKDFDLMVSFIPRAS